MTKNKGQVPGTMYPSIPSAAIDQSVIECAVRADAKAYYPTNQQLYTKYIADNRQVYYLVTNTWYLLLTEYCGSEVPEFKSLLTRGLLPLIRDAQETADCLIQESTLPVNLFTHVLHHISSDDIDELRKALQVLRYPKRFSPYVTDALEEQCITDFRNRNNKAKMLNRKEIPFWLASRLREVTATVLADWRGTTAATRVTCAEALPKGATAEGCKTAVDKVRQIEIDNPLFFYPYNLEPIGSDVSDVRWCRVVTVPKTYRARRVIAEEQCYRQTAMYSFFQQMDHCIETSGGKYGTAGRVTLHDQTRNQSMAMAGSVSGALATVDLSAASDSVTAGLVRTIFPAPIVREWDAWRSEIALINDKPTPLHLYATMGSRLTFGIETICFWAITCVAVEEAAMWLGKPFTVDDISVYGDDIIAPVWAYETLIDLLEICGFTVNQDKSYATGWYRESCGCEYYAGYDISSQYYPRAQIELLPEGGVNSVPSDAVAQVIALQHRLYSHRTVNVFLTDYILSLKPDMTFSVPGSAYTDIWSDYIPAATRCAYKYTIVHEYDTLNRRIASHVQKIGECIDIPREYHYVLQTDYSMKRSATAERWAYMVFLMEGPYYATPLDELLGVSSPRPVEGYQSSGTSKLVRKLS